MWTNPRAARTPRGYSRKRKKKDACRDGRDHHRPDKQSTPSDNRPIRSTYHQQRRPDYIRSASTQSSTSSTLSCAAADQTLQRSDQTLMQGTKKTSPTTRHAGHADKHTRYVLGLFMLGKNQTQIDRVIASWRKHSKIKKKAKSKSKQSVHDFPAGVLVTCMDFPARLLITGQNLT